MLVHFCSRCKGPISFFCMSLPAAFVEKTLISPLNVVFLESVERARIVFFVCSQFHSVDLCVQLNDRTILSWLLLLYSKFWNQQVWILQMCSSYSFLFGLFWVPCNSIWSLETSLSISTSSSYGFLIGILLTVDQFGEYCFLNNMKSSHIATWAFSIYLNFLNLFNTIL